MDERWLLDPVHPPASADELREFGDRTIRRGEHLTWAGPVDPSGVGMAPFRADLLTAPRLAFALTYGGLPKPPYRVYVTCDDDLCVSPRHLTVAHPDDHRA